MNQWTNGFISWLSCSAAVMHWLIKSRLIWLIEWMICWYVALGMARVSQMIWFSHEARAERAQNLLTTWPHIYHTSLSYRMTCHTRPIKHDESFAHRFAFYTPRTTSSSYDPWPANHTYTDLHGWRVCTLTYMWQNDLLTLPLVLSMNVGVDSRLTGFVG